MTVFELICELTHFDPYCEIKLQDKSGDVFPLSLRDLAWDGSGCDSEKSNKYKSSVLFITLDKEIE